MKKRVPAILTAMLVAMLIPVFASADEPIQESIVFKSIYSDLKLGITPGAAERIIDYYKTKFKVFQVKELRMVNNDPPKAIGIVHDNEKDYLELDFKENKLIRIQYFYASKDINNKIYRVEISKSQTEDGTTDRFINILILRAYKEPKDAEELLGDFLKIAKNYIHKQEFSVEIHDFNIIVGEFLSVSGKLLINPEGWE